ncbi:MAG TPA: ATP-binding protein [Opitutaceae bacterium]
MPHEYCYLNDGSLVWLNVIADLVIGITYVSISATLAILVYRASKGIPFNGVFLAFGLFIVSCGMTHFMEVVVVWRPMYWLAGYIKVFTALASAATAIALFPLVPKVFALIASAREGEQRRIEIEQLNQELQRFNYSVAHDLRTPLRGIVGLGNALREDFADQLPPRAKEYILRMEDSAARMNGLISDLLRYATVGRQEIAVGPIELSEVVRRAIETLETEIRERSGKISVPTQLPVVRGDPTLLLVIFQNLLTNALKFVAKDVAPEIEISAISESNRVTVFVTDNGIGVPVKNRLQIFGMFERAHPEFAGSGIGLAIVHRAVERLHGTIEVIDSPTGRGTRFALQLPAQL